MQIKESDIKEHKLDTTKPAVIYYDFDRIYLAVSTVYDAPKYSVYTLGNDRAKGGYRAGANINVAHFNNQKDADAYHDYIEDIKRRQYRRIGHYMVEGARNLNSKEQKEFYHSILSMKIGIKTLEKQK